MDIYYYRDRILTVTTAWNTVETVDIYGDLDNLEKVTQLTESGLTVEDAVEIIQQEKEAETVNKLLWEKNNEMKLNKLDSSYSGTIAEWVRASALSYS